MTQEPLRFVPPGHDGFCCYGIHQREFRGISVSGKQGAGKTAIVNALRKLLTANGYDTTTVSFAEPVKSLSKAILVNVGLVDQTAQEADWKYKFRGVPQTVGVHLRQYDEEIWVNLAAARIRRLGHIVALNDDCRFPNELAGMKAERMFTVRIEASEELRRKRLGALSNTTHISETALDDRWKEFDFVIFQDEKHDVALPEVYAQRILEAANFKLRPLSHQIELRQDPPGGP